MPLRDHFRPPIASRTSWEGFYGMWPGMIVQHLEKLLPDDYTAEPRVHLGSYFEIDVCAYEDDQPDSPRRISSEETAGVATELPDQYEYEVLVFDHNRGRQLVAAVELISPANKDRLANRRAFVAKCATLLQQNVCLSIVDLVTTRRFNLYTELLELIGQSDPTFSPESSSTYAVTCRGRKVREIPRIESWAYPLAIGQTLPTLPLWLSEDLAISLDLESSYEETCRVLRIG